MTSQSTAPAVSFITLGCPKNEVDTDRMRAALLAHSFRVVDDPSDADVVVVNTCSFIQDATEESVEVVLDLAGAREPGRFLVVTGCMPSRYGRDLAESLPEVDAFLSVAEEETLPELIEQLTGFESAPPDSTVPSRALVGATAYLQIADGCHRRCSYCIIPKIRGPYRSRPLHDIVAEAETLVALGAKEIVLIGQDTTAYGRDLEDGSTLADVVSAVASTPGVIWLRIMYAQPDGISDELLRTMASHDNVCRYLDMPLQHASEKVLRAMKRRGNARSYLDLIARIRSLLPGAVLRTTFISGFPGETRADSAELLRFVEQAGFDYVGVFPYSAEEGTAAAVLEPQVVPRTRRARTQRLRDTADALGFERTAALVGREVEILVEGIDPDEGVVFGRWRGQAPEVDGIVLLDSGSAGEILTARIVDTLGYDLEGEVV